MKHKSNLKNNLIFSVTYQIFVMVLPFILTPYLSRVLNPVDYGAYNHANSFAYYFFLFMMLGVNSYGTREIAKVKDDRKKLSNTFWQIYYIQFFLAIIGIIIYAITVKLIGLDSYLYYIQIIYLASVFFDVNWYAFGIEEFQKTTTRFAIMKVVTIFSIFILVKKEEDIWVYALIMTVSVVISLFFVWPMVFQKTDWVKPNLDTITKHIKPDVVLLIPIIASSVFSYLDNLMIGFMCDIEDVAYYSYANSLPNMLLGITTGVTSVLLSHMSYLSNKSRKRMAELFEDSIRYSTILNLALTFGSIGVAKNFISVYLGERYQNTLMFFYLMICTVPLNGLCALIKTAYMIPTGKDNQVVKSSIIGAISKVGLNILLILVFGVKGACISSIIAYLIIALIQFKYTKGEISYLRAFNGIPVFIIASLIMLAVVTAIDFLQINIWLRIFLQVACGGFVYLSVTIAYLYLIKDRLIIELLNKVRKNKY